MTATTRRPGNRRAGRRSDWRARSVSLLCRAPRPRAHRSDGASAVKTGKVRGSVVAWRWGGGPVWDSGAYPTSAAPRGRRGALVHAQDLDARRAQQDLAEGAHPPARVLVRSAAVAQPLELVEAGQLHLE